MEHTHDHNHGHDHEHTHTHTHTHTHSSEGISASELEEVKALLSYMCDHNMHHMEELADLTDKLPESVAEKVNTALGTFEAANIELSQALEKLNGVEENHEHEEEEEHIHEHGEHTHSHPHVHDPKEKKRQVGRLARVIGHLEYVKRMLENDEDCSNVLMQISASKSALNGLGKSIINEHMTHCIVHAIEDGDTEAVEEFQKAIEKYL